MTEKYYTWEKLQQIKDKRVIPYALQQLEKCLGYEPTPIDVINVLWDDHFKVVAF